MSALPETAVFVERFCNLHAIGHADMLRLTLIVEELFSNTVVHGYRGESDAPIHVSLSAESGEVGLLYEDAAPPHDPLAAPSPPVVDLAAGIDSRPIGKLGVHLIRHFIDAARYERAEGRNRLWLRLHLKG